jgi:hypothetical protein
VGTWGADANEVSVSTENPYPDRPSIVAVAEALVCTAIAVKATLLILWLAGAFDERSGCESGDECIEARP